MIPPGSDMAESEKMIVDGRGKREGGTRIAPTKKVHLDARSCWALEGKGDGALEYVPARCRMIDVF